MNAQPSQAVDWTGKEHDGATVLCRIATSPNGVPIWEVRCACGTIFERGANDLAKAARGGPNRLRCMPCTNRARRCAGLKRMVGCRARRKAACT